MAASEYSYCQKCRQSVSSSISRISPIYTSKLGVLISLSNVESTHYIKCMYNSSANANMEVYKDQPLNLHDMVYDFLENRRPDNTDVFRMLFETFEYAIVTFFSLPAVDLYNVGQVYCFLMSSTHSPFVSHLSMLS